MSSNRKYGASYKRATDYEDLPEAEKKRVKRALRKTVKLEFDKLYRRLQRVLNAMEYEYRWKGSVSPDNVEKRDDLERQMISLMHKLEGKPK